MRLPIGVVQQQGGGQESSDMLTGLYECWEFDEASFGNAGGEEQAPTAGLHWNPVNSVGSVTGLLDGGAGDGAADMTNPSGAYRFVLAGTDAAHNTQTLRAEIFGAGAVGRSFSWVQWFYPTADLGESQGTLVAVDGGAVNGWFLSYYGDTHSTYAKRLLWVIRDGSSSLLRSAANVTLNAWNFVGLSFDISDFSMKLWHGVGGATTEVTGTGAAKPNTSVQPIHMKTRTGAGDFAGQFRADQAALYTERAINKATFDALYNGGSGLLRASWT